MCIVHFCSLIASIVHRHCERWQHGAGAALGEPKQCQGHSRPHKEGQVHILGTVRSFSGRYVVSQTCICQMGRCGSAWYGILIILHGSAWRSILVVVPKIIRLYYCNEAEDSDLHIHSMPNLVPNR